MQKKILTKTERILLQNKNNTSVMNVMWFVFICVWGLVFIFHDVEWKVFASVVATWIFCFIDSLSKSIRLNNLVLLIEEKSNEE